MDQIEPAGGLQPGDEPRHGGGPVPVDEIVSYHAHIYYAPDTTRVDAERLRLDIGERFPVRLGRWHDVTVGPHTRAMYQVAFERELFATFVPWLMLNRRGLAVLVHPNTDNPRHDHAHHALWMGEILAAAVEGLPLSLAGIGEEIPVEEVNTTPTKRP